MRHVIETCSCVQCAVPGSREMALDYYDRHLGKGCYSEIPYGSTWLITDAHIYAFHARGQSTAEPVGILS